MSSDDGGNKSLGKDNLEAVESLDADNLDDECWVRTVLVFSKLSLYKVFSTKLERWPRSSPEILLAT